MGYRIEGNRIFSDEEWADLVATRDAERAAKSAARWRLFLKFIRSYIHFSLLALIICVNVLHMEFLNEDEFLNTVFDLLDEANIYMIIVSIISVIHLFINKWVTRIINIVFLVYIFFVIQPTF